MTTPGFNDIDTVLSGVTSLIDGLDRLRRHAFEVVVTDFSRRSIEADVEHIRNLADGISDAAGRLLALCHETNRGIPMAETAMGERSRDMT